MRKISVDAEERFDLLTFKQAEASGLDLASVVVVAIFLFTKGQTLDTTQDDHFDPSESNVRKNRGSFTGDPSAFQLSWLHLSCCP